MSFGQNYSPHHTAAGFIEQNVGNIDDGGLLRKND